MFLIASCVVLFLRFSASHVGCGEAPPAPRRPWRPQMKPQPCGPSSVGGFSAMRLLAALEWLSWRPGPTLPCQGVPRGPPLRHPLTGKQEKSLLALPLPLNTYIAEALPAFLIGLVTCPSNQVLNDHRDPHLLNILFPSLSKQKGLPFSPNKML